MEPVLAVLVLYRMRAEESPAFVSLRAALAERTRRGDGPGVELMVCDNTPQEQMSPVDFDGEYLRDTSNPGLAHWYGVALQRGASEGRRWLMLLDQDTTVTGEYLDDVLQAAATIVGERRVVALVPKLVEHGVVCSPALPPVLGAPALWEADGLADTKLIAFNSGAVLRVSALLDVGGFPESFPLDYLDHATFAVLQARGGRMYVLRSELQHTLSSNAESTDAVSALRQAAVLEAERRFYARYGTTGQRWLRRVRLLKAAAGRIVRGREGGQTWRMIKAALHR